MFDSITTAKYCPKCKESKPATTEYFSRYKSTQDGLQAWCKSCMSATNRAHYAANREQERIRGRGFRLKNPAYRRNQYQANPERQRDYNRKYRAENKEARRAAEHRREAHKRNADGTHTAMDEKMQYKVQKGKCHWCGVDVGEIFHVDHVIPLSRGGSNGPENIVIACVSCNTSKGNKMPNEWVSGRQSEP